MKILLGSIPLGCDNIGDEAIIGCVIATFKELFPQAELTVSTAQKEGLNVKMIPLLGFANETMEELAQVIGEYDLFVWAGATGLSDYPDVAVNLLNAAEMVAVPQVVWSVGMDSELNPAFFKATGRKRKVLDVMTILTLNLVKMDLLYESLIVGNMRKRINNALEHCKVVFVRNKATQKELYRCGFMESIVSADSAIIQKSAEISMLPEKVKKWSKEYNLIGVCVASQRAIAKLDTLRDELDNILDNPQNRIVFIPMNPVTDSKLMTGVLSSMRNSARAFILEDCNTPELVQAVAKECKLIISSRLHLLILASNELVPIIGIGRGSKISVFLAHFGLKEAGDFDNLNVAHLRDEFKRIMSNHKVEIDNIRKARTLMLQRFNNAKAKLAKIL